MTEPIELKDYSPTKEYKELCKALQKKLDEGEHNIITINGDSDNSKLKVFDDYDGIYCTQKYVGVLIDEKGNKFIIGSRFDKGEKQYFLQYLFEKAFGDGGKILSDMGIDGKPEAVWDFLLMYLYIEQLKKALRKGVFRKYRQFQYNDSKVKGQIDIARHIRLNPLSDNGKIAYNAREYTAKNYYNILLLCAFDIMQKKYPTVTKVSFEVKRVLDGLRAQNENWSTVKINTVLKETERKIVHNVYRDYEELRMLSRLIIRNMGMNVFSGERNKVSGVLVDITKLWENFLYKTILKEIGATPQKKFSILNGHRNIQPDFYFENKKLVLDAKYKDVWSKNLDKEYWDVPVCRDYASKAIREDLFQVLAYMFSLKCNKGGVIFPIKAESENTAEQSSEKAKFKNTIKQLSVCDNECDNKYFYCIPVYLPENEYEDYGDFSKEMNKRMNAIKKDILNILNK